MITYWHTIGTAPFCKTVLLSRAGDKFCVTAYRLGAVSGWRHAHGSEPICFEPTHWMPLPAPPELDELSRGTTPNELIIGYERPQGPFDQGRT